MINRKKLLLSLSVLIWIHTAGFAQFNCFSVLAGKATTTDGSILFAHNEDDYGDVFFNIYIVPGSEDASTNKTDSGEPTAGTLNHKSEVKTLWLEMPGMHFSDSYMNEYGVVIASDACPSREDQPELTDGGITWELRHTMAREGRSARHAVKTGIKLLEERGYNSSGRTYCIADPNEAWMLSVVNGKHYVAKRIPEDAIAVIPNFYTITEVNLNDPENVMASPDLITYAQKRGWYHPEKDGAFSFRKAYGSPESLSHPVNTGRMWAGYRLLSDQEATPGQELPWVFTPSVPVDITRLMEVLSNHYEGTPWDAMQTGKAGDPHDADPGAICAEHTRYGFVAHLQNGYPGNLGCVMWLAPYRPCIQAWFPLYPSMTSTPKSFAVNDYQYALENHFQAPSPAREFNPEHAYWQYFDLTNHVNESYAERAPDFARKARSLTRSFIENQVQILEQARELYSGDPAAASELLTRFSIESAMQALEMQSLRFNFTKPQEFKTMDSEP